VFFKGCPLKCKWCHNPESQDPKPFSVFHESKCISCGRCLKGEVSDCPTGARETIGYEISASELLMEINKDRAFYEQSQGGVTFSGGEPFFQGDFLLNMLARCKEDYINTAIDTSGYCSTEILLKAAELANYILYDIKFIDPMKHEKYCGVPNKLILENLNHLKHAKTRLLIKIINNLSVILQRLLC